MTAGGNLGDETGKCVHPFCWLRHKSSISADYISLFKPYDIEVWIGRLYFHPQRRFQNTNHSLMRYKNYLAED